jgi:hypothetical protein
MWVGIQTTHTSIVAIAITQSKLSFVVIKDDYNTEASCRLGSRHCDAINRLRGNRMALAEEPYARVGLGNRPTWCSVYCSQAHPQLELLRARARSERELAVSAVHTGGAQKAPDAKTLG